MKHCCLTFAIAAALICGACSDSSDTPTTPTTTVANSISGATALQPGQTATYTLNATPAATTVTWASSNPNSFVIDSTGLGTAVGVGISTITATGDAAQSATLTVQTVPVYQGSWTGTAKVIACTDLAGFSAITYCARNLGTTQNVTLALSQSGLSVGGTMTKSEATNILTGTVAGSIGAGGDVSMGGSLAGLAGGSNLQLTLISWNSVADGTRMTGSWSANITSPQVLGIATLQWSLTMQQAP